MTAQETTNANFFDTTLTNAVGASDLSITLDGIGTLTSPAYLVIDPNSDSKREVILADGTWSGNTVTLTSTARRGLAGSGSGAQAHDAGTLVVSVPLAQHIEDLNDRVDATAASVVTDHGALTGLADFTADHGTAHDAHDHTTALGTASLNDLADLTAPTKDLEVRSVDPAGLTGATAASRYVGATASGAPATGTFAVGDFVIDQTGSLYVCTVAGTPGTWTQVSGTSSVVDSVGGDQLLTIATAAPSSPATDDLWFDSDDPGAGGSATSVVEVIAETVLGAAAATITFASIPQTYETLMIVLHGRGDAAANAAAVNMQLNNDTAANYAHQRFYGGDTAAATTETTGVSSIRLGGISAASTTAGNAGIVRAEIPGYARTVFDKVCLARSLYSSLNVPSVYTEANAGHWDNTAAVTEIDLALSSGSFVAGTVATLYGMNGA